MTERPWIARLIARVEAHVEAEDKIKSSKDKGDMNLSIDRDLNGNKTLRVKFANRVGFTIQTNGNLPMTHRMTTDCFNYKGAADELREHISKYGTLRQRDITGWTNFQDRQASRWTA
jgi:hypothetical protein